VHGAEDHEYLQELTGYGRPAAPTPTGISYLERLDAALKED